MGESPRPLARRTQESSGPGHPVIVGHSPRELLSDIIEGANSEVLSRIVTFPLSEPDAPTVHDGKNDGEASGGAESKAEGKELGDVGGTGMVPVTASLSHVLTNIVILQEFVLEIAAVMHVRAALFGEVKFV